MKKLLLGLLLIILLVAGFAAWKVFLAPVNSPEGKFFYIATGSTYKAVTDSLIAKKIINGTGWFNLVAKQLKYNATTVKPGKYEITKGMSLMNLVRMLRNGRQTPVNIVIIKFRTKEEFAKRIARQFEFDSIAMLDFLNNNDSLTHYGVDSNTWAFDVIPDTYTYFWNSTPSKVFGKMYEGAQKFWTAERKQKAADHGLTPLQVCIMASIIDEETNRKEDKGNIASVYINRINKNMPLQADPTVKFAMKEFGLTRIYYKYLDFDSPYNTYRNKGLPPGPICTPSVETIDEVLNSPKTDYIYFVANSDLKGGSIFTTNYEDHKKYAKLYSERMDKMDSTK